MNLNRVLPLCAALVLALSGTAAGRADDHSVSLSFVTDSGAVSGAPFSAYKVAETGPSGEIELLPPFKGAERIKSLISEGELPGASSAMLSLARAEGLSHEAEAETDGAGSAELSGLSEGVYLIAGGSIARGARIFVPVPFLIRLPFVLDGGGVLKRAEAEVKYEIRGEPPLPAPPDEPPSPEPPGGPSSPEPPVDEPPAPSGPERPEEPVIQDPPKPDEPEPREPAAPEPQGPPHTVPGDNPQTGVYSRAPAVLISAGLLLLAAGTIAGISAERGELAAQKAAMEDLNAIKSISADAPEKARDSSSEFIGELSFPKSGRSFAVRREWSDELLLRGPCRVSGSAEGGDLIIAGHNYRSHFRTLWNAAQGDRAEFRDLNGDLYCYEVLFSETVAGSDTEAMSAGDWDMTLFTCTADAESRVAVRFGLSEMVPAASEEEVAADERDPH